MRPFWPISESILIQKSLHCSRFISEMNSTFSKLISVLNPQLFPKHKTKPFKKSRRYRKQQKKLTLTRLYIFFQEQVGVGFIFWTPWATFCLKATLNFPNITILWPCHKFPWITRENSWPLVRPMAELF